MTTYRTGNPIGSTDPKDLYDNAENTDVFVNSLDREYWDDRFGRNRKTIHGMYQDFQEFLIKSGYVGLGPNGEIQDYAAGLQITERNQVFRYEGELYRAGAELDLPYTTTGDWETEGSLFVAVGDAVLRQELLDKENPLLDSEMVTHHLVAEGSTETTVYTKLNERVSINQFGAETDANSAIQSMADFCDEEGARYVYIPNWKENYLISNSISLINPGVKIFGDQSSTYNRGKGKNGWLIGEAGLTQFFDLGASRTGDWDQVNPADQWQVQGLSFKQNAGVPARTVDGIAFTSRTDGPDRGAKITDSSFVGLQHAIRIDNPDVSVALATLDVNGCVFVGCSSAIRASGNLLGLRFEGNQCEQNGGDKGGVISGAINGPVTIKNNMLEGQPNTINIEVAPLTGNSPRVDISHNYFELNSGDYVVKFSSTAYFSLNVGPNYDTRITAKDYLLIERTSGHGLLTIKDRFPVTFNDSPIALKYGSNIFGPDIDHFEVRKVPLGRSPIVVIDDYFNLIDTNEDNKQSNIYPGDPTTNTPFGRRTTFGIGDFARVDLPIAAGDLVAVNILCSLEEIVSGNLLFLVYEENTSTTLQSTPLLYPARDLKGRWALITITMRAERSMSFIRGMIYQASGQYKGKMLRMSARNYGQIAADGSQKKKIYPKCPRID